MKIAHTTSILTLILSAITTLLVASCKPQAPENEPGNKLHDDPTRMEITLFKTHFHGMAPHANADNEGVKYGAAQQKVVLELVPGKGLTISPSGQPGFIVAGNIGKGGDPAHEGKPYPKPEDPKSRTWTDQTFVPEKYNAGHTQYGMLIRYFNKAGEDITYQFATNGQEKIHQHFFLAKNIRWMKNATSQDKSQLKSGYNYYYYYYYDTTPWDKLIRDGAKFTGISNPIGLKGYFEFYQSETVFDLNILLLHASRSKFLSGSGKTAPFTGPTPGQKSRDAFDLNISIPVWVYADEDEFDEVEFEAFENMTPKEHAIVRRLAEAANVTEKEAFESLNSRTQGEIPPHDPNVGLGL